MKNLKYEYHLQTWGGFYNEEHQKQHKKTSGNYYFDTEEEREKYVHELQSLAEIYNARMLMMDKTEGYHCRIMCVIHRVIETPEGIRHYSKREMANNYPYLAAKYHLEYKWTPGFNDEPFGDDYDYSKVKIIEEWITGSFTEKE